MFGWLEIVGTSKQKEFEKNKKFFKNSLTSVGNDDIIIMHFAKYG